MPMTNAATFPIEARPEPVPFVPSETAVIVVDMQNDFAAAGGMLARAGADIAPIRGLIEPIANVLDHARRAGARVVYLKMEYRPDLSDLGSEDSVNAIRHRMFGVGARVPTPIGEGRLLVRGTWNTAIVDELAPEAEDIVVSKRRFSGFFDTELDTILRGLGIRTLVFTGCTTSVCVESTLRDAFFRDYRCVLLEDCTAEPIGSDTARTNHEATVLLTERLFGWVADSGAFVRAVATRRSVA